MDACLVSAYQTALCCRGISYDKLGQFEDAIADFTRVLELDPTNVNAFFNRGSAYDSLGQYEKAVADYTRALDLDSSAGGDAKNMPTGEIHGCLHNDKPTARLHVYLKCCCSQ